MCSSFPWGARYGDAAATTAQGRPIWLSLQLRCSLRCEFMLISLRLCCASQISEVRRLLDEAHKAHLDRTAADAEAYEQLHLSDRNAAAQMAANTALQSQLLDSLSHWRSKALSVANEWAARNRNIAAERAGMSNANPLSCFECWPMFKFYSKMLYQLRS